MVKVVRWHVGECWSVMLTSDLHIPSLRKHDPTNGQAGIPCFDTAMLTHKKQVFCRSLRKRHSVRSPSPIGSVLHRNGCSPRLNVVMRSPSDMQNAGLFPLQLALRLGHETAVRTQRVKGLPS